METLFGRSVKMTYGRIAQRISSSLHIILTRATLGSILSATKTSPNSDLARFFFFLE